MKIDVKGAIVSNNDKPIYDMFGIESTSPNVITDAIDNADGEDLEIVINSGGGDLFSGSEIFSQLKSYSGNVTAKIYGVAASSASIIAMGANDVRISPAATFMVHNPTMATYGDHNDMGHSQDMLQSLNKTVAGAYEDKTGMDKNELLALMEKESWFDASEAVEKGFVDGVLFREEAKAVAGINNIIPQPVLDELRNNKAIKNDDDSFSSDQRNEIRKIAREEIKKQSEEKTNNKQTKPVNSWLF